MTIMKFVRTRPMGCGLVFCFEIGSWKIYLKKLCPKRVHLVNDSA